MSGIGSTEASSSPSMSYSSCCSCLKRRPRPPPRLAFSSARCRRRSSSARSFSSACRRRSSSSRCFAAAFSASRAAVSSRLRCSASSFSWTRASSACRLAASFASISRRLASSTSRLAASFASISRRLAASFSSTARSLASSASRLADSLASISRRFAASFSSASRRFASSFAAASSRLRCSSAAFACCRSSSARRFSASFSSRRRRRASPRDSFCSSDDASPSSSSSSRLGRRGQSGRRRRFLLASGGLFGLASRGFLCLGARALLGLDRGRVLLPLPRLRGALPLRPRRVRASASTLARSASASASRRAASPRPRAVALGGFRLGPCALLGLASRCLLGLGLGACALLGLGCAGVPPRLRRVRARLLLPRLVRARLPPPRLRGALLLPLPPHGPVRRPPPRPARAPRPRVVLSPRLRRVRVPRPRLPGVPRLGCGFGTCALGCLLLEARRFLGLRPGAVLGFEACLLGRRGFGPRALLGLDPGALGRLCLGREACRLLGFGAGALLCLDPGALRCRFRLGARSLLGFEPGLLGCGCCRRRCDLRRLVVCLLGCVRHGAHAVLRLQRGALRGGRRGQARPLDGLPAGGELGLTPLALGRLDGCGIRLVGVRDDGQGRWGRRRELGVQAAQLAPLDLPGRRLRELGDECDLTRAVVRRGDGLDMLLELGGEAVGRLLPRTEDDERLHDLAAVEVRDPDDGALGDRGMLEEGALDLERADAIRGRDDHVVRAPHEPEVAVLVALRPIARQVPVVPEDRVGLVGRLPVAGEEGRRAADQREVALDSWRADLARRRRSRPRRGPGSEGPWIPAGWGRRACSR